MAGLGTWLQVEPWRIRRAIVAVQGGVLAACRYDLGVVCLQRDFLLVGCGLGDSVLGLGGDLEVVLGESVGRRVLLRMSICLNLLSHLSEFFSDFENTGTY